MKKIIDLLIAEHGEKYAITGGFQNALVQWLGDCLTGKRVLQYWRSEKDGKWYYHLLHRNGNIQAHDSQGYEKHGTLVRVTRNLFGPAMIQQKIADPNAKKRK